MSAHKTLYIGIAPRSYLKASNISLIANRGINLTCRLDTISTGCLTLDALGKITLRRKYRF